MNAQDTNSNVTDIRTQATNLKVTLSKMNELLNRWVSLDQGNTMDEALFSGENEGQTVSDLASFISTTTTAFNGLMDAGHRTNVEKVIRFDSVS